MVSWFSASLWLSSFSRACTRWLSESDRKRTMMWEALLRPCTSSGAPFCASITRSKAMLLSRSAAMAFSSPAAERGITQRPKARKEARSSGAPLSAGSVPSSSGFRLSLFQTMMRWSRRLSSASERWMAALRSATRLRSSTFSAAVLARSRIRKTADRSAAPITPANIASCITSAVPKEKSVRAWVSCACAKPAPSTAEAADVQSRVLRRDFDNPAAGTRHPLPPARAAMPESLSRPESTCPA
jgi:hypothetical protein